MPPTKRSAATSAKGAAAGGGRKEAKKTEAAGAAEEKSAVMQLGGKKVKMTYSKALEHWQTLMRLENQAERDSLIQRNMDLDTAMYGPNIVTQHGPMDRNVLTGMTLFDDDLEDVEIPWMEKPRESDFGPEMISADNEDMASQVFFMPWYVSMVQALAVEVQKLRKDLARMEPVIDEVQKLREERGQSRSMTPVNEAAEDAGAEDDAGGAQDDAGDAQGGSDNDADVKDAVDADAADNDAADADAEADRAAVMKDIRGMIEEKRQSLKERLKDLDCDDDDEDEHILFVRTCCESSVHVYQIPVSEIPSDLTQPLARYLEMGWNGVIVESSNDPSSFSKQEQEISKYVESGEYNLAELFEELLHQDFDKYLVQPGGDLKTTHKYLLVMS
tara:strand:- start:2002 stop:3165 length:1164 start_codon:yes stop_codon:yes gene_type:complete